MKFLIEKKVNVNWHHYSNHETALFTAVAEGKVAAVILLLENGADPTLSRTQLFRADVESPLRKILTLFLNSRERRGEGDKSDLYRRIFVALIDLGKIPVSDLQFWAKPEMLMALLGSHLHPERSD